MSNLQSAIQRCRPLGRLLELWQPDGWYFAAVVAIFVGALAGVAVWVFKELIVLFQGVFGALAHWFAWLGPAAIIPSLLLSAVIVGLVARYWIGEERHHGVTGIIESVALAGGRLRYWRIPAKVLGSALSIGAGASVGPEDPSVQMGANLGSMFGQLLHMSDERTRVLVAAGCAAGVSAAFNAPIAGVFFAIEIILAEIGGSSMGIVLLASVTSAAVTQALVGADPAFTVPPFHLEAPWHLLLYLVLGLLAGPVAALYIHMIYWLRDWFHALHAPPLSKPVLAGLIVGILGIFLPQILGVGYPTIEQILHGEITAVWLLLALALVKLIATPTSLGGGFMGGVFAPSLFIGAALGGMFGNLAVGLLPGWNLSAPSFAMVGMAAVLAGTVHAPLTAIILLFEMTNDYTVILPLMFAVVASVAVSQRIQRHSVYMLGLARKGVHLERGRDVDVLESMTVGEVMQHDVPVILESASLQAAIDQMAELHSHGLAVVDDSGRLSGILSLQDIDRAREGGKADATVGAICTHNVLVAYQDETLAAALRRMSVYDVGRLPVVTRMDRRQLVGMLRRVHVVRAYDVAMTRRAVLRQHAARIQLGAMSGVDTLDLVVAAGAPCANKPVRASAWPGNTMIATIRRGDHVLVPRGDTVLEPGDVLTVIGNRADFLAVRSLCGVVPDPLAEPD